MENVLNSLGKLCVDRLGAAAVAEAGKVALQVSDLTVTRAADLKTGSFGRTDGGIVVSLPRELATGEEGKRYLCKALPPLPSVRVWTSLSLEETTENWDVVQVRRNKGNGPRAKETGEAPQTFKGHSRGRGGYHRQHRGT